MFSSNTFTIKYTVYEQKLTHFVVSSFNLIIKIQYILVW